MKILTTVNSKPYIVLSNSLGKMTYPNSDCFSVNSAFTLLIQAATGHICFTEICLNLLFANNNS